MGKDKKTRRLKRTKAKTERLQDILLLYNLIIFFHFCSFALYQNLGQNCIMIISKLQ